jgi:muconolactone delta-isomerase
MLESWAQEGKLDGSWIRQDRKGAFLLLNAADEEEASSMLDELPLRPHIETDLYAVEGAK